MPGAFACPDLLDLEQLLLGRLPAEAADGLEEHVAGCARCGEAIGRLRAEDALVEAMRAPAAAVAADDRALVEGLIGRLKGLPEAGRAPDAASTAPIARDEATPAPARGRPAESYPFLGPPRDAGEIGRLGPYRVLGVVGSGGMGVVFRAEDPRVKRAVALKVLLDTRCADPRYPARFQTEAEAVGRLRHPNIVQLHEVGAHDGRPYLVLEYVEGGNLAEHLAGRPQPPRAAAELVAILAGAVQHAHQMGVVHRDLKPANVLLAACGLASSPDAKPQAAWLPKITDFGLAKRLDEEGLTQTGDLLGTPGYMAPELTRGHGPGAGCGPAADVYGLGAILYELLVGRPPFRGASVVDTLEQVRTLEPVAPRRLQPKVPRDLETICLKCLDKEPARRYASAQELADDLARFRKGEPIRARPASPLVRLGKWARRKPALAALVAVSAVSLAALAAGALVYQARLRAAVERAEAGEAEARRQQELAAANYRAARDALNRMLDRLDDSRLAEVPRLKELQRGQMEDALVFYQEVFKGQDNPDPAVRQDIAGAYMGAGYAQIVLGQPGPAAENVRRAIALLEGLPEAQQAQPGCQNSLATCYRYLGSLADRAGRVEEMERACRRAVEIMERLLAAEPESTVWREGLATSEHLLGSGYLHYQRWAEAEEHLSRAAALRTRLVREHPGNEAHAARLADEHGNLGYLYLYTGRPAEAGTAFAKAEQILGPLVRAHPEDPGYALSLAAVDANWAKLLQGTGRLPDALRRASEAVDLAEAVLRHEPRYAYARSQGYSAHGVRALVYQALGRWADAARDWDRLIELDDRPNPQDSRVLRAAALACAGEQARALAEATALADGPEPSPDSLLLLTCVFARGAGSTRADTRLPPVERAALAERYAARAVALLKRLRASGYFRDAGRAGMLKTEPDLQPLRDRADFRQLLAGIEAEKRR